MATATKAFPFPTFDNGNDKSMHPFKALIKRLTETYGPSGHEHMIRKVIHEEIKGLAVTLKDVLLRMHVGLENPDFNYVVRSLSTTESDSKYFHWYISVIPRITQTAGFELGTGMYINTALPEESARFLREVSF